jgi:outer membrane protein TolC
VASAAANIESVNQQLATAQAALPDIQKLFQIYQQAEKRGDIDGLTLYSARSTLLAKRIAIAKLQQELMQNWVALELACGRPLPRRAAAARPATMPEDAK